MHLFSSFLKICKKWFSNLKHKTKQNSKAGSYFQLPAHWVLCASWLIWAPVCSPSYLISSEVLTVHQRHLVFHAFILGIYVSLLSSEAASHCSSTKHYHQEKSIYDIFPNQLQDCQPPSLNLAYISTEQAEMYKEAVEMPDLGCGLLDNCYLLRHLLPLMSP